MPRPHCYRCDKPARMCICAYVTPVPNHTAVHVLQHPKERRHPIGTARLLRVGLQHVHVHVVHTMGASVATAAVPLPPDAALLYPSEGATDLAEIPPEARPSALVVIDGTWSHAHRMYRDNPWIQALPHVRLSPTTPSRYRIRTEPRFECLSTVEAVASALTALEPALSGTDALLDAFDRMIDDQIAAAAAAPDRPRHKRAKAQRPSEAVPAVLRDTPERVLAVYAEPAPGEDEALPTPLRVSATTLGGTAHFDRVVHTHEAPDTYLQQRMGLTPQALLEAEPWDAVASAFDAFCEDHAITALVAWGPWTVRLLEARFPHRAIHSLKGSWANLTRGKVGALDTLVQGLDLPVPALPLGGRAGTRLAQARALARHLGTQAPRP